MFLLLTRFKKGSLLTEFCTVLIFFFLSVTWAMHEDWKEFLPQIEFAMFLTKFQSCSDVYSPSLWVKSSHQPLLSRPVVWAPISLFQDFLLKLRSRNSECPFSFLRNLIIHFFFSNFAKTRKHHYFADDLHLWAREVIVDEVEGRINNQLHIKF